MRLFMEVIVVIGLIVFAWETPIKERFQDKTEPLEKSPVVEPDIAIEPEIAVEPVAPRRTPPQEAALPSPAPTKPESSWMWEPSKMDGPVKKEE